MFKQNLHKYALFLASLFLLTACSSRGLEIGPLTFYPAEEEGVLFGIASTKVLIAKEMGQKIIDGFIAEDEEAVYDVLSLSAQNFEKTREQIQEAFEFIDGEIISYELSNTTGGGGSRISKGELKYDSISCIIENIETDTEKKYSISASYVLVHEEKPEVLGITSVIIELDDGSYTRVYIGFEPDK